MSRDLDEVVRMQGKSPKVSEATPLGEEIIADAVAEAAPDDEFLDDEDQVDGTKNNRLYYYYSLNRCRERWDSEGPQPIDEKDEADLAAGIYPVMYQNHFAACMVRPIEFTVCDVWPVCTSSTMRLTIIAYGNRGKREVRFRALFDQFDISFNAFDETVGLDLQCMSYGNGRCADGTGRVTKTVAEWLDDPEIPQTTFDMSSSPGLAQNDLPFHTARDNISFHEAKIELTSQSLTTTWQTFRFRCDTAEYASGGGCLFHEVQAVHRVDTRDARVAAEAQHIRDALYDPRSTVPSSAGKRVPGNMAAADPEPLTRMLPEYNPSWYDANHAQAVRTCKAVWGERYAETDPPSDCDEFPYRSTEQGSNYPIFDPDWPFSYSARALNASHNRTAGAMLGAWYRQDHILHGDNFWVEPTGCAGCGGGDDDGPPDPGPTNVPPSVDAGPDRSGDEGSPVTLDGTVTDPDDVPIISWTYSAGDDIDAGTVCTFGSPNAARTTITCTDDGTFTVTLTADDGHGPPSPVSDSATVTLRNVAPTGQISSPTPGQMINARQPARVDATFTDPAKNDTHTCLVDYGESGGVEHGRVSQQDGGGTCTANHVYGFDGLGPRTITTTLTDDDNGSGTDSVDVVVFVPGAGHALSATGAVGIDPTPDVRCPPDDSQSIATLDTAVASLDGLTVTCTVSPSTGRTEVHSEVLDVTLLEGLVTISGLASTCTADSDGITRTSTVGRINGIPIGTGTGSLTLLGLVEIHYNEQTTDSQGRLVQNAVRANLLGQEIVIASCRLG
ncbi:choice-of-anchor P family protein [Promicromonospora sp. MS192]|uniref:choice-of-anchor P family protein n=1 Tax=Promicromonospora sp. MS192 TaxID=3412684 RepID=UPI003C2E26EA